MTNENILDAIGGINENAVQDAKAYKRPKSKRWFRWGAMAACLCLVVGIAIPILHHKGKGGIDHQDPLQDTAAFELNGKFYEVVETPEVLEKYGLPSKITEDVAGDHVAYLKSDGDDSYECTPIETDMELYQYNPAASNLSMSCETVRHGVRRCSATFISLTATQIVHSRNFTVYMVSKVRTILSPLRKWTITMKMKLEHQLSSGRKLQSSTI